VKALATWLEATLRAGCTRLVAPAAPVSASASLGMASAGAMRHWGDVDEADLPERCFVIAALE
jgi:hypothetical protein